MDVPEIHDEPNPYRAPEVQERVAGCRGKETVGINLATDNPFLSIWTRPRATIRGIIDAGQVGRVGPLILAAAIGLGLYDGLAQANGTRPARGSALVIALAIGSVKWFAILYFLGWFLTITGRWLGGKCERRQAHIALAWSCIPIPLAVIAALVETAFGGLGHTTVRTAVENPPFFVISVAARAAQTVLLFWWLVIALKVIAEVHRFSVWMAMGAFFLVYLIAVAVFAIVYGVFLAIPALRGLSPWSM
jgi:Yip1 domain